MGLVAGVVVLVVVVVVLAPVVLLLVVVLVVVVVTDPEPHLRQVRAMRCLRLREIGSTQPQSGSELNASRSHAFTSRWNCFSQRCTQPRMIVHRPGLVG